MPTKRTAYKELRKGRKRHARNISIKSELKTAVKKFEKLLADKKIDDAKSFLKELVAQLNRAASKGIIRKENASRKTSRLTTKLSHLFKT